MVARQVELVCLSASDGSEAVRWSCDGSPNFSLEAGRAREPGTDVILHLMEEELEYIEPSRIRTLITTYCDFLPVAVQLEGETVNKREAPWRKSPRDLSDEDYIALYRYLYPFQGDPLLWVHLNTDYPYNLQGILYFPRITGRADWEKGEIRLYCNQVFVSDSIKEVVPRYLLPLRGVIDSPDIPLNVSRSALQTDRRVRSIGGFVAKKVGDRLKQLHRDEPDALRRDLGVPGPLHQDRRHGRREVRRSGGRSGAVRHHRSSGRTRTPPAMASKVSAARSQAPIPSPAMGELHHPLGLPRPSGRRQRQAHPLLHR